MSKPKVYHEGPHKYMKIKFKDSGYEVYKCMIPACTHFIRKELAIGNLTICWGCGNEFVLTPNRMIKKPTCGCKKRGKGGDSDPLSDFLKELAAS